MISASPDGITTDGHDVRNQGSTKQSYNRYCSSILWVQMQQQMAVCDLDAVDFVECQIEEYNSREAKSRLS